MAPDNNQGFTLIEVLLAMAIFLIGFLAVGAMQISAVNSNTNSRMRTEATVLATDVAEQLIAMPYEPDAGTLGPYSLSDPLIDGTHTPASGDQPDPYAVQWVVTEAPSGDTKTIDVTVRWQKKGRNNNVQLSFMTVDALL